ncbi:MAG: hypothetical protein OHK0022_46360 [Roseiflexaceae bacterium]
MTNTRRVRYFIVGDRPVKYIHDPAVPSITTEKYDWETGVFVPGGEYLAEVTMGTGDVEEVEEDEFIQQVERLRRRDIPAQGALLPLYELINATEDVARAAGRKLTAEERALIASLQRQTHQLFESATAQGTVNRRPAGTQAQQSSAKPALVTPKANPQGQPSRPAAGTTPSTPARPATPAPQGNADRAPDVAGPPGVRAAFERLLAISWKHDHTREGSNLGLLREYFRRMAHWGRALNCVDQWPFFDVAAQIDPAARVDPAIIHLLHERLQSQPASTRMAQTCEWFLHWSLIAGRPEVQRFGLLPPYDPLILMYERGGSFHSEHGFYYVGSAGMSRGLPKDYTSTEPIVPLDPQVLDAYDQQNGA